MFAGSRLKVELGVKELTYLDRAATLASWWWRWGGILRTHPRSTLEEEQLPYVPPLEFVELLLKKKTLWGLGRGIQLSLQESKFCSDVRYIQ